MSGRWRNPRTPAPTRCTSPRLLPPGEAAAVAGFHRDTLRHWAAAGRIPFVQPYPGAHHRYPSDVMHAIRAGTYAGVTR